VGSRPQFIVVNPLTNRIYVNNGGEASLTVIDGATDTNLTPTPLQIGSQGPMAINNETNILYVVRMSSVATDEVTFVNASSNTWYSIATESFQPTALTINPNTNTLYVAHYGTGDVRVISGEFNNTVLHPTTFSIGAWSKPFAIAANSMTNKIYVITEDSRGRSA
jgi:DNA-binding beta-propeller fold protein YncE